VALLAPLAPLQFAQAETLHVDAKPCAETVALRAEQVPLRQVLERLAETLSFRLQSPLALDEQVTLTRRASPEKLLEELLRGKNVAVQTEPAARCGGASVVTTVWVMPAGEAPSASAGAAPSVSPAATAQAGPYVRPERPRGTRKRMSEAEWQQMKEDYKAGRIKADPETGLPVPVESKN
jgi:hypothetical protein